MGGTPTPAPAPGLPQQCLVGPGRMAGPARAGAAQPLIKGAGTLRLDPACGGGCGGLRALGQAGKAGLLEPGRLKAPLDVWSRSQKSNPGAAEGPCAQTRAQGLYLAAPPSAALMLGLPRFR